MFTSEGLRDARHVPNGIGFDAEARSASTMHYYEMNAAPYATMTAGIDTSHSIERFVSLLDPGGRVLDAGCGGGRDLLHLSARGFSAIGLDLSPDLADIARRRSGCEVIVGNLLDPPPMGRFDGIWAMASLLHIERPRIVEALSALAAMLKPDGVLFSSVKRGRSDLMDDTGRWFTLYNEAQWARHLRDAGFEVIEIIGEPPSVGAATGTIAPGWISSLARLR